MITVLAKLLRRIADRVDPGGATKPTGWTMTYEPGEGARFRKDGRGCPVRYLAGELARSTDESTGLGRMRAETSDLA